MIQEWNKEFLQEYGSSWLFPEEYETEEEVLDFVEQIGPCDVYFYLDGTILIQKTNGKPGKVRHETIIKTYSINKILGVLLVCSVLVLMFLIF
jgi:hypothetical protein